jgi:hypothetical protein
MVESPGMIRIDCESDDRTTRVAMQARPHSSPPRGSLFQSPQQVLQVLPDELQGKRLATNVSRATTVERDGYQPRLVPLQVDQLQSSIFEDPRCFPTGTAEFDSAYWLRREELARHHATELCWDIAPA